MYLSTRRCAVTIGFRPTMNSVHRSTLTRPLSNRLSKHGVLCSAHMRPVARRAFISFYSTSPTTRPYRVFFFSWSRSLKFQQAVKDRDDWTDTTIINKRVNRLKATPHVSLSFFCFQSRFQLKFSYLLYTCGEKGILRVRIDYATKLIELLSKSLDEFFVDLWLMDCCFFFF